VLLLLVLTALAVPATVLAARSWTLAASPTTIPSGSPATVTLTVRNVGGNGGGDELSCAQISIPASFSVSAAAIVSVKGATSGHGWVMLTGSASGKTLVTLKNPPDKNPLVGLPDGDSAVFRITGTAASSGSMTWTGTAADKPGGTTSTACGSGAFSPIQLAVSVTGSPTPTPAPTPTPTPAPTPTPKPTPAPTPKPTPKPTPTATPAPTATPRPSALPTAAPTPRPTLTPTPLPTVAPSGPPSDPVPSQSPTPGLPSAPTGTAGPSSEPGASSRPGTTPSGSGGATSTPAGGSTGTGGGGDAGAGGADGGSTSTLSIPLGRRDAGGGPIVAGLDSALGAAFEEVGLIGWTVPAVALSVPGILVLIVVGLQLAGGAAWLPLVRRMLRRAGAPNRSPRSTSTRRTPPAGR
jgi:hypothetical protein